MAAGFGLVWLLAAGVRIAQDEYKKNRPYYGTKRDFLRNNPEVQALDRRMEEIYKKCGVK